MAIEIFFSCLEEGLIPWTFMERWVARLLYNITDIILYIFQLTDIKLIGVFINLLRRPSCQSTELKGVLLVANVHKFKALVRTHTETCMTTLLGKKIKLSLSPFHNLHLDDLLPLHYASICPLLVVFLDPKR